MAVYADFTLNMKPGAVMETVRISQGEALWRILRFRLYNGGSVFTIPSGSVAVLNGRKPDGRGFSYTMDIVDTQRVSIPVKEQMSAVPGRVICEVSVQNNDEVIGSVNFIMMVEPSPLDGAVLSDSDMEAVVEAVANIGAAVHSAEMAEYYAEQAEHTVTGVIDWNNRAGHVSPASGDYSAQMVTYGSNSNVKSALDSLDSRTDVIEADMNDWKQRGTQLTSGTDLFTGSVPANPGRYYCYNAATAAALINSPSQYAFALWVASKASSDSRVLVAFDSAAQMYVAHVLNTGTNYDTTSASGWKRLLNINDLASINNALDLKAPLASPPLTGTPTAPTANGNTTTQIANVQYVANRISAIPNATQSARGMMSANDKKYVDEMRARTYGLYELRAAGDITIGNNFHCWIWERRGQYALVCLDVKITVANDGDVVANDVLIINLPKPHAISPCFVLASKDGSDIGIAYISSAGNLVNDKILKKGKTYYGSIVYLSNDANDWYDGI